MESAVQALFLCSALCVAFGAYILHMDTGSSLRIVFFLLCTAFAATILIAGFIFSANDRDTIAFWEKINFVLVVLCWSINLNFYILLTERKMRPSGYALLYCPAVALILVDLLVCHIVEDYVEAGGRWKYVFSPMYFAYMAYSISYCAADMTLVYQWAKKSPAKKHRLQARMILGSTIPLWIVCAAVDYVLPQFSFQKVMPIGPFGRIVYIIILWYSFVKYRFMTPTSSVLLRNIVLNMDEIVILLDREARVLVHNKKFNDLSVDGRILKRCSLYGFIEDSRDFREKLDAIFLGKIDYSHANLIYKRGEHLVQTSTYLSGVLDNYGDVVGVLLISREKTGVRQFCEKYRISERQMEIINLMLAGISNSRISEKLGISKRTTETHIFNIYCKLGIENKIELYNFASGFRLVPTFGPLEEARESDSDRGPL